VLAIVIVTYNSADPLPGLLDSIPAGLEGAGTYQVVIADNASSDGSAELGEAHPVKPLVVRTGRNGGYAAGINAALEHVAADADVLILNPDVRLSRGCVRPLLDRLRDPGIGVVAPIVLHEDGTLVHSLRREPAPIHAWADAVLPSWLRTALRVGEIIAEPACYRTSGLVDWANGAAIAYSGQARRLAGPWDESYFLYSEEVDFQRRVREAGLAIAVVPSSRMVHIGGDYRRNPRLYAILTRNRIRYFRRFNRWPRTALFRVGLILSEGLRAWRSPVHRAGLKATLTRTTGSEPLPPANPALSDA